MISRLDFLNKTLQKDFLFRDFLLRFLTRVSSESGIKPPCAGWLRAAKI